MTTTDTMKTFLHNLTHTTQEERAGIQAEISLKSV